MIIKMIMMIIKTKEKQTYLFSIPDYYTYYQKEALKKILESLKLNNEYPFINESTALTMYYGYLNYKELTNEKKYVIFVDIGHSKTSFILSEFTKKEFIVKEVENIPFLGGRDFNDRIFEKCLKQFEKENNKSLEVNGRNKYKLYDEIEKARKNLTINDSASINIDALDGDNDFSYEITKEEFEKIIKNEKKQLQHLPTFLHISLHLRIDVLEISVVVGYIHIGDGTDSSHHVDWSIGFLPFIQYHIHHHLH